MSRTRKHWPYLKFLADVISEAGLIPGTKISAAPLVQGLTRLQADFDTDKFRDEIRNSLSTLLKNSSDVVELLRARGSDVSAARLAEDISCFAEAYYKRSLAQRFRYADFKGIEQDKVYVSLEMDDIYVDLRISQESKKKRKGGPQHVDDYQSLQRKALEVVAFGNDSELTAIDAVLEPIEAGANAVAHESVSIYNTLLSPGGSVVLGGPGTGKTTAVKRLARWICTESPNNRGDSTAARLLPVAISVAGFNEWRKHSRDRRGSVIDYIEDDLDAKGGEALLAVFRQMWGLSQCVILLDGLDEIAQTSERISAARAVDHFFGNLANNCAIVTSRIIGYDACRLSVHANHWFLEPFSKSDISEFCLKWHIARDKAAHPLAPRAAEASRDSGLLLEEISSNASISELASNPLMLTIIALIKQSEIKLPERRVELYEKSINTLLVSWNKARSIDENAPVVPARRLRLEDAKRVWGNVAHWMHSNTDRGTLRRRELQNKLTEVLMAETEVPRAQAVREAEEYLETATDTTGLLEARGPRTFAFIHQTFQEYLAADQLAIPTRVAVQRIEEVVDSPRWHEIVCLAAGIIGIYQRDTEALADLIDLCLRQEDDLIEQVLCTRLIVICAAISDDVGFRQKEVIRTWLSLCRRISTVSAKSPVQRQLVGCLRRMPLGEPSLASPELAASLIRLMKSSAAVSNWELRIEVVRKLAAISHLDDVRQFLEELRDDDDQDIRIHARVGLWQIEPEPSDEVAANIVRGVCSPFARLEIVPSDDLTLTAVRLLLDDDVQLRRDSTHALISWGRQSVAIPALMSVANEGDIEAALLVATVLQKWDEERLCRLIVNSVLKSSEPEFQLRAVRLLGRLGQETLPVALSELFAAEDPSIRCAAAEIAIRDYECRDSEARLADLIQHPDDALFCRVTESLQNSTYRKRSVPRLQRIISSGDSALVIIAARVLGAWEYKHKATLLLEDKIYSEGAADLAIHAADLLLTWGESDRVFDALIGLLESDDAAVADRSVELLCRSGIESTVVPQLLDIAGRPGHGAASICASEVLASWKVQDVVPTLLEMLNSSDADVSWIAAPMLEKFAFVEEAVSAIARDVDGYDEGPIRQTLQANSQSESPEKTSISEAAIRLSKALHERNASEAIEYLLLKLLRKRHSSLASKS